METSRSTQPTPFVAINYHAPFEKKNHIQTFFIGVLVQSCLDTAPFWSSGVGGSEILQWTAF